MLISSFYIDSFGPLREVEVEGLSAGLNIFLGQNEAGKSTCLEFFRVMLTGYPYKRGKEVREDIFSGQGGRLGLETQQGRLLLTRRPGSGGGTVSLSDAQGNALDVAVYEQFMAGITKELYRSVYGFSLSELQSFSSLEAPAVRNALYGASFGLGIKSPGNALQVIRNFMASLYKPGGSNPVLSRLLREFEDLKRKIAQAEGEMADYDSLVNTIHSLEEQLVNMRHNRGEVQKEILGIERRLSVWELWEEWKDAKVKLQDFPALAPNFPIDGLSRLERALERFEQASRHSSLAKIRCEKIEQDIASLEVNFNLLACGGELRSLAERKASFRNAMMHLPQLLSGLERTENSLAEQLLILGPGWNTSRIRQVDRSLFVREDLEKQAEAMHVAQSNYGSTMAAADKIAREAEEATWQEEAARKELLTLPVPLAELDEPVREALRRALSRTEDAQARLPERQRASVDAQAEYGRVLSYLHLKSGQDIQALEKLGAAQDEAMELVRQINNQNQEVNEAKVRLEQSKENERQMRQRMSRLQSEKSQQGIPSRGSIESRKSVLKRLASLIGEREQENSRAQEASSAYEGHVASMVPMRPKIGLMWLGLVIFVLGIIALGAYGVYGVRQIDLGAETIMPLSVWLGALCAGIGLSVFTLAQTEETRRHVLMFSGGSAMLLGGGVIVARKIFDIKQLLMKSGQVVPLEMWSGYLILLCGVICLILGMGRKKAQASPQKMLAEQLKKRMEGSLVKLRQLDEEVLTICRELGLNSPAIHEIEALEQGLDADKEKIIANERIGYEMLTSADELEAMHKQVLKCENDFSTANSGLTSSRRRWHDFLMELGVSNVPSHDSAQTFFVRVETGRGALNAVKVIKQEIADLQGCSEELRRMAVEVLPKAYQPQNFEDQSEVVRCVHKVLEACREADLAAEERARLKEALRGKQEQARRLENSRIEIADQVNLARAELDTAQAGWQKLLQNLDLSLNLSPATTREAFECMDRALSLEAEINRLRGDIDRQSREREAFIQPLQNILQRLGREGVSSEDMYALSAQLDSLLEELEEHKRREEAIKRLEQLKSEQKEEYAAAQAVQKDRRNQVDELFALAEVSDAEAFRGQDMLRVQRENLQARVNDLKLMLGKAAQDKNLEYFLEEFNSLDRLNLIEQKNELETNLALAQEQEQLKADQAGNLRAKLEQVTSRSQLTEFKIQEAALHEEVQQKALEWSRYALAQHLLVSARQRFEQERQPEVIRVAASLFSKITGGAWSGLSASLEDGDLRLISSSGLVSRPDQLSRGAQEQLYLCLRLAYIRNHGLLATSMPVIMDDILVNFDPKRTEKTAAVLGDLAEKNQSGPGHQILYFTCHPHIAELLAKQTGSHLYHVDKGRISQ